MLDVHCDGVLHDWFTSCWRREALGSYIIISVSCFFYNFISLHRGAYLVRFVEDSEEYSLHQYDVATMSCVREFSDDSDVS